MKVVKLEDLKKDSVYVVYLKTLNTREVSIFTSPRLPQKEHNRNILVNVLSYCYTINGISGEYKFGEYDEGHFKDGGILNLNKRQMSFAFYELNKEEAALAVLDVL